MSNIEQKLKINGLAYSSKKSPLEESLKGGLVAAATFGAVSSMSNRSFNKGLKSAGIGGSVGAVATGIKTAIENSGIDVARKQILDKRRNTNLSIIKTGGVVGGVMKAMSETSLVHAPEYQNRLRRRDMSHEKIARAIDNIAMAHMIGSNAPVRDGMLMEGLDAGVGALRRAYMTDGEKRHHDEQILVNNYVHEHNEREMANTENYSVGKAMAWGGGIGALIGAGAGLVNPKHRIAAGLAGAAGLGALGAGLAGIGVAGGNEHKRQLRRKYEIMDAYNRGR